MFYTRFAQSPEAPAAAPAAPVAAPSAGPAFSSPGIDDIFGQVEKDFLAPDDMTTDTMMDGSKFKDMSVEDMLGDMDNNDISEEDAAKPEETVTEDKPAVEQTETKPSDFKYQFKGNVDGEEFELDFESPEQMDTVVKQALYGKKVYKEYKEMKEAHSQYQEEISQHENDWQALDTMISERPMDFLDTYAEDIPEDVLRQWMSKKIDEMTQAPEVREHNRMKANYEKMIREQERATKQAEELQAQQQQFAQQQERQQVDNWGVQTKNKVQARFPDLPSAIIDQTLEASAMLVGQMKRQGQKISLDTLNEVFVSKMKPIVDYHNKHKTSSAQSQKQVQAEVGKAIQNKKEQTLNRVQNAANPQRATAQGKIQDKYKQDPMKVFDLLEDMVSSGRARIG